MTVSVMTLTCISYERYYAIVYPFSVMNATKSRALKIILLIWIFALVINLPKAISYTRFNMLSLFDFSKGLKLLYLILLF